MAYLVWQGNSENVVIVTYCIDLCIQTTFSVIFWIRIVTCKPDCPILYIVQGQFLLP